MWMGEEKIYISHQIRGEMTKRKTQNQMDRANQEGHRNERRNKGEIQENTK